MDVDIQGKHRRSPKVEQTEDGRFTTTLKVTITLAASGLGDALSRIGNAVTRIEDLFGGDGATDKAPTEVAEADESAEAATKPEAEEAEDDEDTGTTLPCRYDGCDHEIPGPYAVQQRWRHESRTHGEVHPSDEGMGHKTVTCDKDDCDWSHTGSNPYLKKANHTRDEHTNYGNGATATVERDVPLERIPNGTKVAVDGRAYARWRRRNGYLHHHIGQADDLPWSGSLSRKIEKGTTTPMMGTVRKITGYIDLSLEQLVIGPADRNEPRGVDDGRHSATRFDYEKARKLRQEKGWSQADLTLHIFMETDGRVETASSTIGNIEQGRKTQWHLVYGIAQALDVPIEELIDGPLVG